MHQPQRAGNYILEVVRYFIYLLILTFPAHTDAVSTWDGDSVPGAVKFKIIKTVPGYSLSPIPKGGKSRFYGEVTLPKSKSAPEVTIRLHMYVWPQPSNDPAAEKRPAGRSRADIFVRRGKRSQFRRVASILSTAGGPETYNRLPSDDFDWSYNMPTVFAELLWLDPKEKRIPLVRLCCVDPDGFHGSIGLNSFVALPKFAPQATSQTFQFFFSHTTSEGWSFEAVDKKGRRYFVRSQSDFGYPEHARLENWIWDGKQFAPNPSPHPKNK